MLQSSSRLHALATVGLAALLIAGSGSARAMTDPLEPINRAVFAFNNAFIDYVVEPVGSFGQAWLPDGVKVAARNVYTNLSEPEFILTNLFQGNFADAGISTERVVINTIVGIGGIYDPATRWGLVAQEPEFSEAVCSLGVPAAGYLEVPLVGPGNVSSAAVLGGFTVGHVYLFAMISTWLAATDVAMDTFVAAAMLRHSTETVGAGKADPYTVQRDEYYEYIETACAPEPAPRVRPTSRVTS